MRIVFINQVSGTARIPRAVLLALAARTQKLFKQKMRGKSLCAVFASARESKKLNSKYRAKKRATNVLSFESAEADELGDIIICPEIARKESGAMRAGFNWWVSYLFVHGLLHLIGYDHKTKSEENKMDKLIQKIICE
ncbi:rRNA maturation RNase YbeY [Patescibacteria group bacterium]|nr:rRNA maturation RNase YbeY [Patescibacteria group bacterium]